MASGVYRGVVLSDEHVGQQMQILHAVNGPNAPATLLILHTRMSKISCLFAVIVKLDL